MPKEFEINAPFDDMPDAELADFIAAVQSLIAAIVGAAEAAIHLTGRYPDWWEGRRWDRPVRVWAGSETGEVTRDGVQRLLIGEPKDESQWGTGLIPGEVPS